MTKLRHQKQFSHGNEKQCELIYPDRKKSKLACTELSAVTARLLLVSILMPFTICSNRASKKTDFLDRGKNKGYISVVLWFLSHNYFLLATSFRNLNMTPYTQFFTLRGLCRLASLSYVWLHCPYMRSTYHSAHVLTHIGIAEFQAEESGCTQRCQNPAVLLPML